MTPFGSGALLLGWLALVIASIYDVTFWLGRHFRTLVQDDVISLVGPFRYARCVARLDVTWDGLPVARDHPYAVAIVVWRRARRRKELLAP